MLRGLSQSVWLASLLALLFVASLWSRPLFPVDETRYAAVAWEMHQTGQWLVPHINGEPYSHKPPLLFWLINMAWSVAGVHDTVTRLVGVLIAFGNLLLLQVLARQLWPDRPALAPRAGWLLLGCLTFMIVSTMLMFDLLMSLCVLTALIGLVRAGKGAPWGWGLFALGVGLGLLAKGPAVFLYVLPCALLARWWAGAPLGWRWYARLSLATLAGIAIGLAWALPAVVQGGEQYRQMLLWGQTAGRMTQSFAHSRPWWWYLPLLPVMLLPWTLWLPLWRQAPALWRQAGLAERFCVAWFLPGLLAFSLISGKQIHYLVPLLAALALLGARCLEPLPRVSVPARVLAVLPFVLAGGVLACAPLLASRFDWPAWVGELSPLPGLGLVLLAVVGLFRLDGANAPVRLSLLAIVFMSVLQTSIVRQGVGEYSMVRINAWLDEQTLDGTVIGFSEDFRDQFPFTSRLRQPAQLVAFDQLLDWAAAHPQGVLVMEQKGLSAQALAQADAVEDDGSGHIVAWRGQTLLANPQWAARRPQPAP